MRRPCCRAAASPPEGQPPTALSQQRQVFPGPELDDHRPLDGACLRTDDSCFLAFGNLRGRNGQSDVGKAGRGSIIPRKFLPHHVTFSKSARISHHEPTAQRLLPVVWGATTSRGLASGGGKPRFMAALLDLIGRLHHDVSTRCRSNSVSSAGMPKTGPSMASRNPVPVAPRAGPPRRRQLSRPGFTVPACPACKPVPGLDPAYIMDPEAASKKESFGCSLP